MLSPQPASRPSRRGPFLRAAALAAMLAAPIAAGGQGKISVLRIGTSGTLSTEGGARNENSSLETLKSFIKDETGLDNEIIKQKNWQELAEKMSKGELDVGVFQGFEFARARPKYPDLKPLAVAVNVYVNPVVYVVSRKDDPAKDFASLQGRSLVMVADAPGYLQLYVDRQCQLAGKKPNQFFSKITNRDNFEDAIDDVVDGVANATVADRATLEAYKVRKPGRFGRLKPVAQSQPFPPATVAYYGNHLDDATRRRFRKGLLDASGKEKGKTMLTLFRLTGFQPPPADFDKVLAATRDAYPPSGGNGNGK
jgi:ABC-type phosphate/phosphonate transport system substrate-binding protein